MNWLKRTDRRKEAREIEDFLNPETNVGMEPPSCWTGVIWGFVAGLIIAAAMWGRIGIDFKGLENIVAVLFVIISLAICWFVAQYVYDTRFERDKRWLAEIRVLQRKIRELEDDNTMLLDLPLDSRGGF